MIQWGSPCVISFFLVRFAEILPALSPLRVRFFCVCVCALPPNLLRFTEILPVLSPLRVRFFCVCVTPQPSVIQWDPPCVISFFLVRFTGIIPVLSPLRLRFFLRVSPCMSVCLSALVCLLGVRAYRFIYRHSSSASKHA